MRQLIASPENRTRQMSSKDTFSTAEPTCLVQTDHLYASVVFLVKFLYFIENVICAACILYTPYKI
jgi:hypothetical protein